MKPRQLTPVLLAAFWLSGFASAQEPERKVPKNPGGEGGAKVEPKEKLRIEKVGETRFRMGKLEFDAKSKEIYIPSEVNKREGGPIEYVLVNEKGKVHESILTTAVSPIHLQVVMKLLKFQSGYGNVFDPLVAEQEKVHSDAENGQPFTVTVRWKPGKGDDSEEKSQDLSEWVVDGANGKPMEAEPWTYTGSAIRETVFMAEVEGSIIATYLDPMAMFNMTRKGSEIDDRWGANEEVIPDIGHRVTVVLQLAEKGD